MQIPAQCKSRPVRYRGVRPFLLLPLLIFSAHASLSQNLSLTLKKTPLEKAFRQIEAKVEQRFVYTREMLAQSRAVTLNVQNAPLENVLNMIFENQPLEYALDDRFIKVRFKTTSATAALPGLDVQGRVFGADGNLLSGATVLLKGKRNATATTEEGKFLLQDVEEGDVLVISNVGYVPKEIPIRGRTAFDVHLDLMVTPLDETVVMAYGTTTKRLSTGNIGKVGSEEISKQPVSNPLAALQGRIPGLLISQSSGLPGAGFSVQIRGQNSILQGSEPLFIIDGVPFAPGNNPINQVTNATNVSGLSPLNLINPAGIESIEILKDADATAIYGSRGANGVILITTKKGKAGTTKFSANVYTGWSRITRTMDMLQTPQYLQMRREAFQNDGIIPDLASAPDLLVWDTTRYTDLKKLLIGGTARTTDAQVSFSGGNAATQFLIGGGFRKETTVLPTDLGDQRASAHFNLTHSSGNQKFTFGLTGNYLVNKNQLHFSDPIQFIGLPPTILLYDQSGKLNWEEGGITFNSTIGENPLANFNTRYVGAFSNLISNLQLGYKPLQGLQLRVSLGYNAINSDEKGMNPSTSLDPNSGQLPFSYFAAGTIKSWIVEPQAEYNYKFGKSKINLLLGATAQENVNTSIQASAMDYSGDAFLGSLAGAGSVTTSNAYTQYRYNAFFGRVNYNWNDQYLLNLSGRRDGSSRFGINKRFNNFGAVGVAWIFSAGDGFKKAVPVISFGKLRASYGITGNDQIGDYRFLDTWTASPFTYQGVSTLDPTSLYNPEYEWERNGKLEVALELGFLKDYVLFSAAYFRNQSGNQIVQYSLPAQTGFSFIGKNLDASIQNTGLELQLTSKNVTRSNFNWTTHFNIAVTRNKLLSFPSLATSSYAAVYTIGQPLSSRKVYQYLGIDSTGVYQFTDVNKDGKLDRSDWIIPVNTNPDFYGGLQNSFSYKGIELSLLLEFRKQKGRNYLYSISSYPPGTLHNQPAIVLNRWQKPGDVAAIQKFTSTFGSAAYSANAIVSGSDAIYGDASFIRCRNVALSYNLPETWLKRIRLETARVYLQAQNLFTITGYEGADPENQNLLVLPPLRTISAGIQFNFN